MTDFFNSLGDRAKAVVVFLAVMLFIATATGIVMVVLAANQQTVVNSVVFAGIAMASVWFLWGLKSIIDLPESSLTRIWAWVMLTVIFSGFLVWIATGTTGIKALVSKAGQWQTSFGSWLHTWSQPKTNQSQQDEANQQTGSNQGQSLNWAEMLETWLPLIGIIGAIAILYLTYRILEGTKK